jgi:ABC-2 type transport system ATP-binding protein
MSSGCILTAHELEVRYKRERAVRGISVTVDRGEVVGLIGPDGAGKTSTIRVLAGLHKASSGSVEAFGRPIWAQRRALQSELGYLAQRFALYGDLTVAENVRFFALLYGVHGWRKRRDELLDRVGLASFADRLADRLSGGMKQKLALACTLIHSPSVLLLDEPTTGVDPVTRRELWRLLAELVADGLTLVVATPYLDEAERCTRVVLMHRGEVLADAPPAVITASVPGKILAVHAGPRELAAEVLAGLGDINDLAAFGSGFHLRVDSATSATAYIRNALQNHGVQVHEIREVPTGLEDAFLYLTRTPADLAEAS